MPFPPSSDYTAADLLDRYLANELSANDRLRFEQRLADEPELALALARLRAPLEGAATSYDDATVDLDAAWGRQRWQIQQSWSSPTSTPLPTAATRAATRNSGNSGNSALPMTRAAAHKRWWTNAASIGLAGSFVALFAFAGWYHHAHATTATPTYSTYTTRNGQQATVTLPDGASAVLNAASRLDVPGDYAAGNHQVQLSGEALFTVAHHARVPFTVIAGGRVTRVLGTSFVVRKYDTDAAVTVAVREGKVAVQSDVLTAGQQVTIDPTGHIQRHTATAAQFAFATGTLALDNIPMRAAITELNRWYDADIRLGSSALDHVLVKGEFAAGSRADLKIILEMAFGVRVVSTGRVLTLYPR